MEINWNGSTLFFEKTGSGSDILLLFHGFGQDHNAFNALTSRLSAQYTCYSFDLFFHGNSRWKSPEEPIGKSDWKSLISAFMVHENISEFSLLGFSIGARFVLATFEAHPQQTRRLIFIAPDGIKQNFWFRLATYPLLVRAVFRKMIINPGLFNLLTSAGKRLRLASPKLIRFAESQMSTEERRKKVYYTWTVFRRLTIPESRMIEMMNAPSVAVSFYLGKYDLLIKASEIETFIGKLRNPSVHVLDVGHHQLLSLVAEMLYQDLTTRSDIRR